MGRFTSVVLIGTLGFGLSLFGQTRPDNTDINRRDRDQREPTADQQRQDRPDRVITSQIRRSLTSDKRLSTYARNIKVITQNGRVTLRGPVRSAKEKLIVLDKANKVVGADRVTSEIEIATKRHSN